MTTPGKLRYNPWAKDVPTPRSTGPVPTTESAVGIDLGTDAVAYAIDPEAETVTGSIDIQAKPYGGIIVKGAGSSTEGMVRFLDWCMHNMPRCQDTLTDASVLLIELETTPANGFYIRRPDGWTLCVPHAQNKNQALVQIIQAILAFTQNPVFSRSLENTGISAYRL